ncbi:MAG: IclR family transcriptional regulator [Caldilineaceae bacterium]
MFALLRVVSAHPEGASVTLLAQQTGLAKSTVSRICATLERLEALTRLPDNNRFQIGRGLVALVANLPYSENLIAIAHPYLQQLNQEIGETVAITLPEGDSAYVAYQITSNHAIQVRDWTGMRIPMYVQSTGRVFLAERSSDALDRYFATPRQPYTTKTICDPIQLRTLLDQIKEQGYAWVIEEFEEGLSAVAAPIRDGPDIVVAAVNVFGPSFRFPGESRQELVAERVMAAAQQISARLQEMRLRTT